MALTMKDVTNIGKLSNRVSTYLNRQPEIVDNFCPISALVWWLDRHRTDRQFDIQLEEETGSMLARIEWCDPRQEAVLSSICRDLEIACIVK